jgi:hypothetical protein
MLQWIWSNVILGMPSNLAADGLVGLLAASKIRDLVREHRIHVARTKDLHEHFGLHQKDGNTPA